MEIYVGLTEKHKFHTAGEILYLENSERPPLTLACLEVNHHAAELYISTFHRSPVREFLDSAACPMIKFHIIRIKWMCGEIHAHKLTLLLKLCRHRHFRSRHKWRTSGSSHIGIITEQRHCRR